MTTLSYHTGRPVIAAVYTGGVGGSFVKGWPSKPPIPCQASDRVSQEPVVIEQLAEAGFGCTSTASPRVGAALLLPFGRCGSLVRSKGVAGL